MVKADVKRDYYADLDLPSTADAEEIKKRFRYLAKQLHPDRNPGHEVEVVPKFQAVQAAHEILSDPVEKAKYDAARAKMAARNAAAAATNYTDPYGFARPTPTKQTATPQFPFPPPPKAPQRGMPQQASRGADKFNAFTRSAPQSWDRARFDNARADAARGFPNMRTTHTNQKMPPTAPRQAPTAPKPSPTSEVPHVPNVPPTTFPGLSRTASARKQGYTPGTHGTDDQQAPRSAYAYVRGTRGPPPPSAPMYNQDGTPLQSPPVSRAWPGASPLRPTRSTDYDMKQDFQDGSRPSSRYAGAGGERTDIHGDTMHHRSSSVRNSPIDRHWDAPGPFGKPASNFEHVPRHRSASPGMRSAGRHAEFSSDTSSDEDEAYNVNTRPKATPRSRPRPRTAAFADNPGLTGSFPSTNYTRIVNDSKHQFPSSDSRETPSKPFASEPFPATEEHKTSDTHVNGGQEEVSDGPKYARSRTFSYPWWTQAANCPRSTARGLSFNGLPSWAVPASVFPRTSPAGRKRADPFVTAQTPIPKRVFPHSEEQADPSHSHEPQPPSKFSADEWHEKLNVDDIFRPTDSQMRKSPSKLNRNGSKPATRGRGMSRGVDQESSSSADRAEDSKAKAAAFQKGKLPPDWGSNVKPTPPPGDTRTASDRTSHGSHSTDDSRDQYVVVEEDIMDVDDTPPMKAASNPTRSSPFEAHSTKRRSSPDGGVNLREFTQQAPFAPTAAGLKGLDDLAAHLPFESKPEDKYEKAPTRLRALNLPKPPKVVIPPAADRLDKANFLQYVDNMNAYMQDWNNFNATMLDHFKARHNRVCGTMSQSWVSMLWDGPDADKIDENGTQKAGYSAYLQWLHDDAQCRQWWDHANEKHLQCMEDLGRVREVARRKFRPS
ncbi:hypothetical protein PV08_11491 [Exophiala spinifera]|uniref:J domain-containing protein n=1 Tax=Exophiala spinifera TaxID=91928 RepID=A0A0D1ZC20_9EURO|nr:uncharacterized protein PV08_11491 [Exophiala spinifera]KIW10527.1 hypothetical protein PV08_11491 [Exophiala spinifera]